MRNISPGPHLSGVWHGAPVLPPRPRRRRPPGRRRSRLPARGRRLRSRDDQVQEGEHQRQAVDLGAVQHQVREGAGLLNHQWWWYTK